MPAYDKNDIQRRMTGALENLKHDLAGLRTGRASTALLDPIQVEVYGANIPLNQVATVSVPEPPHYSVPVLDPPKHTPPQKASTTRGGPGTPPRAWGPQDFEGGVTPTNRQAAKDRAPVVARPTDDNHHPDQEGKAQRQIRRRGQLPLHRGHHRACQTDNGRADDEDLQMAGLYVLAHRGR